MYAKKYSYKISSKNNLEFITSNKAFYPTSTSDELINGFKKFQNVEKKIGKTLDLGCGIGIVGIILNYLKLIKSPLYASDTSINAINLGLINYKKHKCKVVVKQGSVFEPWKNEKFDYILNDISGVAEDIAKISPWFNNVPCASGKDGTDLVIKVIKNASKFLNPNGVLFFPILSLSNTNKIINSAKKNFSQVTKISHKEWPLPESMKKHLKILEDFSNKKIIKINEKFGMVLWYTEIYFATNCKRKIVI